MVKLVVVNVLQIFIAYFCAEINIDSALLCRVFLQLITD